MIGLIVGPKGTGKTKALIGMIGEAVKETKGSVVCIEKGLKLTYDINYSVRLVDIEHYDIEGFPALYGFVAGIMAGNYDITNIFVDATLKIGGKDLNEFAEMVKKLGELMKEHEVKIVFTVSCDKSEIPESISEFIL